MDRACVTHVLNWSLASSSRSFLGGGSCICIYIYIYINFNSHTCICAYIQVFFDKRPRQSSPGSRDDFGLGPRSSHLSLPSMFPKGQLVKMYLATNAPVV